MQDIRIKQSSHSNEPTLASRVLSLASDAGSLALDHLELAALEARRAALTLTHLLTAAVIVSILLVTAWLAIVASAIVWITAAGIGWVGALMVAAALNVVLALLLTLWLRGQLGEPLFAATLRQLRRTAEYTEHSKTS